MAALSHLVLVDFSFLTLAFANPEIEPSMAMIYPEVIPGPGLPSLASLNLTSAQLFEMSLSEENQAATSDWVEPVYGPAPFYTNFAALVACHNYLSRLDTEKCSVPRLGDVQFCKCDSATVWGKSLTGRVESSYCRDVAKALQSIYMSCQDDYRNVAGALPAWGNGDLLLRARHSWDRLPP